MYTENSLYILSRIILKPLIFSLIREWYSYHFPELIKVVPDNYTFARCAQYIKNRKELSEESLPELTEIVNDAGVAQSVLDASRSSMGKF